jgi:hypothetical protein
MAEALVQARELDGISGHKFGPGQGAGQSDPDAWMRSAIKSDGTKVCECFLLYTDDTLSIGR